MASRPGLEQAMGINEVTVLRGLLELARHGGTSPARVAAWVEINRMLGYSDIRLTVTIKKDD